MNSPSTPTSPNSFEASGRQAANAEGEASLAEAAIDLLLVDLALWIERSLQNLKHRDTFSGRQIVNIYAVAEIPDWELRQKLEDIRETRKAKMQEATP